MCVKDGTCNQVQTPVHEERGAQEHGDQPKHQGNIRHCPFSWSGLWKFKRPSEERPWRSSHRGHNCECIHLPSVWTGLQHHGIIFGAQQKRTQQQDCTIGNVQLQCWQNPKLRPNTQKKTSRMNKKSHREVLNICAQCCKSFKPVALLQNQDKCTQCNYSGISRYRSLLLKHLPWRLLICRNPPFVMLFLYCNKIFKIEIENLFNHDHDQNKLASSVDVDAITISKIWLDWCSASKIWLDSCIQNLIGLM